MKQRRMILAWMLCLALVMPYLPVSAKEVSLGTPTKEGVNLLEMIPETWNVEAPAGGTSSETPAVEASVVPNETPSEVPSDASSGAPSEETSDAPSGIPTEVASPATSETPAVEASDVPSDAPSSSPTENPTENPTASPTPIPGSFKAAFPDDQFRGFVNGYYFQNTLKDDEPLTDLQKKVMTLVTDSWNLKNGNITDLTGIEYFTNLEGLDASHNRLQKVNTAKLKKLKELDLSYNDLTEVTFAKSETLEELNLSHNELTQCDVTGLVHLQKLHVEQNQIEKLDLKDLGELEEFYGEGNALTALDVSALKKCKDMEVRRSNVKWKASIVGTQSVGVILPEGAAEPEEIGKEGTYDSKNRAIVWEKVNGLPADFTYRFKMTGKNETVQVKVTVDKTDLLKDSVTVNKVEGFSAVSKAYNRVKLTWNGVEGASGYRIYRAYSADGTFTNIKDVAVPSQTSFVNKGCICGHTYYYKIRAYCTFGGRNYWGEYSDVITGRAIPAKTSSFTVKKKSAGKVTITWAKVTGAHGYRVYRSTNPTTGFKVFKKVGTAAQVSFDKKVKKNKKFYYKVRAFVKVDGNYVWGTYSKVKGKKA